MAEIIRPHAVSDAYRYFDVSFLIWYDFSAFVVGDDMVTSPSNQSMQRHHSATELQLGVASNGASAVAADQHKVNTHFMKKIPPGAEASNILVGEVEFLDKTLSAFVRLNEAAIMGDLTEVPVTTR